MGSNQYEDIKNVVWFYFYFTGKSARYIFLIWYRNKILKEYRRPSVTTLRKWVDEFSEEIKSCSKKVEFKQ